MKQPQSSLVLGALAPYEDRLLSALAFFRTKRRVETQALHCLAMYLRQSEARIMAEVEFYARRLDLEADQLLELIYMEGDRAEQLIETALGGSVSTIFDDHHSDN